MQEVIETPLVSLEDRDAVYVVSPPQLETITVLENFPKRKTDEEIKKGAPVLCSKCGKGAGTLRRASEKGIRPAVYEHVRC